MNATAFRPSLSTRLAALAVAMIASSVVLGATVAGMQPHDESAPTQVIALERVTVRATPVN
jgi:hypothetical protein